jgi:hypothetical protein
MQPSPPENSADKLVRLAPLTWKCYQLAELNQALGESYCLYVWHHPDDGERPQYIGKAKFFGTKQSHGYARSARYNSGYEYLIELALRGGTNLYIARLGEVDFAHAESFEQALIAMWQPLRKQRRKWTPEIQFSTTPPWTE